MMQISLIQQPKQIFISLCNLYFTKLNLYRMSRSQTYDGYHLNLEEDYEAIYKDGWRPDPYSEGVIPVGTCDRMCTYDEMMERESQNRLHKYEIEPNTKPPKVHPKLAMKEFSRSAAGREFTSAYMLRPWTLLKQGLHHLLMNICLKDDDWLFISDFVFDRLKSLRQDMIIQRIEGMRCIELLEGSVRYLVYSMYRLTCTLNDFTQDEPFKVKLSPNGTPVSGLNNYEMNVVREMKLTMTCLRDCLNSLIVQYQDHVPDSPNRPLFEAINIIVHLPFLHGSNFCKTDYLSNKELRNSNEMFKTVYRMYQEHSVGNHIGALKHLRKLVQFPLIILAYAPVIAQLQVHLLTCLKKLYSQGGPNKCRPDHLVNFLCPEWLDVSFDERLIFTIFLAIQFGIYNKNEDMCEFKSAKQNNNHINIASRTRYPENGENDSETRVYAMQMIAGRDWSFYRESIKVYGIESVLDPSQSGQCT